MVSLCLFGSFVVIQIALPTLDFLKRRVVKTRIDKPAHKGGTRSVFSLRKLVQQQDDCVGEVDSNGI